jgi:hypothetical protein
VREPGDRELHVEFERVTHQRLNRLAERAEVGGELGLQSCRSSIARRS